MKLSRAVTAPVITSEAPVIDCTVNPTTARAQTHWA